MDFTNIKPDDCMHQVAIDVSAELRETLHELYRGMYLRGEELEGVMPNVVLAGLTLLWLESIHTVFGTADYETALRLVKGLRPNDPQVNDEMAQAARDFLRRSGRLPRRKK